MKRWRVYNGDPTREGRASDVIKVVPIEIKRAGQPPSLLRTFIVYRWASSVSKGSVLQPMTLMVKLNGGGYHLFRVFLAQDRRPIVSGSR